MAVKEGRGVRWEDWGLQGGGMAHRADDLVESWTPVPGWWGRCYGGCREVEDGGGED